jgi:hypothetical protein
VSVSGLWAIGTFVDAAGRRAPWRISHDEINRDVGAAAKVLASLDVAGRGVLWCSMLAQAGSFWPYVCGTFLSGGRLSCADATTGEAVRVAMFLRLMDFDAVFGVTDAILDGLDEIGKPYDELFDGVRIVAGYPGAYERLERAGIAPTRFALCGPAIAIGRAPGAPARPAEDEWMLGADDARIWVSARQIRAQPFERMPTAVRGEIVDGGVMW